MIKVENLSKMFGTKIADNVSFEVNKGEVLGFSGNGRKIDHHAHDHRLHSASAGR